MYLARALSHDRARDNVLITRDQLVVCVYNIIDTILLCVMHISARACVARITVLYISIAYIIFVIL